MLLLKDAGSRVSWRHVVRLAQLGFIALSVVFLVNYLTGHPSRGWFGHVTLRKGDKSVWHGWSSTEYLFVFGDSYTDQGFDPSAAQPNSLNPFGNPDTPLTLTLSTVWLHFLSLTYNHSVVKTYNFAVGGSVIDPSIVPPLFYAHNSSLEVQLSEKFTPLYAHHPETAPWTSRNSLFALWFGINDVVLSASANKPTPVSELMASYRRKLTTLYEAGARNFLLINVPPTYKAHQNEDYVAQEKKDIQIWNAALLKLRDELVAAWENTTVFVFDVHALWLDAFDDVKRFTQTANLTQLGAACQQYKFGAPPPDFNAPECPAPANKYFFQNELHTTYVPHDLTAAMVVRDCLVPAKRKGYCL